MGEGELDIVAALLESRLLRQHSLVVEPRRIRALLDSSDYSLPRRFVFIVLWIGDPRVAVQQQKSAHVCKRTVLRVRMNPQP